MERLTLLQKIRISIGLCAKSIMLWGLNCTEDEYDYKSIFAQALKDPEKFQKFLADYDLLTQ